MIPAMNVSLAPAGSTTSWAGMAEAWMSSSGFKRQVVPPSPQLQNKRDLSHPHTKTEDGERGSEFSFPVFILRLIHTPICIVDKWIVKSLLDGKSALLVQTSLRRRQRQPNKKETMGGHSLEQDPFLFGTYTLGKSSSMSKRVGLSKSREIVSCDRQPSCIAFVSSQPI